MVRHIFAASATMTLVPSSQSVNIGDLVTMQVRENSSTDTVNAVQANLTFDATRLQYVSVDETGSAFGLVVASTAGSGTLSIARGTSGGAPPVSGDNLVTTVTFRALTAGSVPIAIAAGSVVVRSTDNVDILAVKNGTTLTLADLVGPTTPAGLAAPTVGLTSIGLTWTASTDNVGVVGYRIFRNTVQVATSATTSYTDTGLTPGTAYSYKVIAYDAANNTSAQSTALAVSTVADTTAPTVPGKPTSTGQTMTSISLVWTASTDDVGVASYRIYRNAVQVGTAVNLSYTDSGLAVNTSYSYTIAAVDAANNLSAQTAATTVKTLADTQAPTVPTGLQGTATNLNIALTWVASTDNVAVRGYTLYRDGVQFATTSVTNYTATNAPTGSHTYSVSAQDEANNQSAQSAGVVIQVYVSGDINHDAKVNVFDLSTLLTNWAKTGTNTSDINSDGVVNVFDLSILLSNWTG